MNEMKVLVWLFPIIFIFHDFEEIIFMQPWISKNKNYLSKRFPRLSERLLSHFNNITTSSFALGVAEEFLLISVITLVSYEMNSYNLWFGLFIAFTLHLIIHCFQALLLKRYIPAIATTIICLPISIYIINNTVKLFSLYTVVLYSIIGFILMVVNLYIAHKGMDIFNKWLVKYEHQSE